MAIITINIDANEEERVRVNAAETKGRRLLLANLKTLFPKAKKIYFSENRYDRWDSAIEDEDGTRYLIELKFRYMSSTRYSDYMIEEGKFEFLLKQTKRGVKSIYLNFFEDGKALLWYIEDDLIYDCRTYTSDKVTENPTVGKITRSRNMLPASQAKRFDVDLNVTPF